MAKKVTDQKILDLIEVVKKKKAAIAKAEKPQWKTNCSFNHGNGVRYNLQVEQDLNTLVQLLGYVLMLESVFAQANYLLNTKEEFNFLGYSREDWQSDIETRIAKIQIKKEKAELQTLEERLSKLISPELRAELELKEIEQILK